MLTAERLFAERGVDGVSLRQIAAAAGSGNNSVVHYYFGSKDQLVQAVFEYRLPRLAARRNELIGGRDDDSLRSWLSCQVRTVLEQSDLPESHYIGFISSFERQRLNPLDEAPEYLREEALAYQRQLLGLLVHLDEPLRSHRLLQAMSLIIHLGAARERSRERSGPLLPLEVEITDALDATVGLLGAPVSPEALVALRDAQLVTVPPNVYI